MIPITKEEKQYLASLFPDCKFPRTMKGDSKRHHYFCVETVKLMRPIAKTNPHAAAFMKEYYKNLSASGKQRNNRRGENNGNS